MEDNTAIRLGGLILAVNARENLMGNYLYFLNKNFNHLFEKIKTIVETPLHRIQDLL